MAKGGNLLVDGFNGSIGGFTLVQAADGETIIKEKIRHMTNPRTPAQMAQRGKMGSVVELLSKNIGAVNQIGIAKVGMRSAYNRLTSHLLNDVLDNSSGENEYDDSKLQFGITGQADPYNLTWVIDSVDLVAGTMDVTVTRDYDASNPLHDPTDTFVMVHYDLATGLLVTDNTGAMGIQTSWTMTRGRPAKPSGTDGQVARPKKRIVCAATKTAYVDAAGVITYFPKA